MNNGDKIIWDSGFGYDVGYFIEDSDNVMYNTYKVKLITGVVQENTLRSKDEILQYTDKNKDLVISKYKYNKFYAFNK